MMTSEDAEAKNMYPPLFGNSFAFKFKDQKGHMHRFKCGKYNKDYFLSEVGLLLHS